jgi:hypothetical protein
LPKRSNWIQLISTLHSIKRSVQTSKKHDTTVALLLPISKIDTGNILSVAKKIGQQQSVARGLVYAPAPSWLTRIKKRLPKHKKNNYKNLESRQLRKKNQHNLFNVMMHNHNFATCQYSIKHQFARM